jgi:hypothetical protein
LLHLQMCRGEIILQSAAAEGDNFSKTWQNCVKIKSTAKLKIKSNLLSYIGMYNFISISIKSCSFNVLKICRQNLPNIWILRRKINIFFL